MPGLPHRIRDGLTLITDATRDAVKRAVDIADLVAQYVPLRKSGRRMVARCPFHQEKSPSFSVDVEQGLYHCFGCKAGGDVISFYERIEGFQYVEAVTALAERAGIEIDTEMPAPQKAERARVREQMDRLFEANLIAAAFYFEQLASPGGAMARAYVDKRRMPVAIVSEFGLGYAPAAWDALSLELQRRHVSPADGEAAGLLIPNKHGGWYDRFRHRLMFPILDRRSRVIGFSGRILPGAEGLPAGIVPEDAGKYINSPETPLYRKGDHLFGLAAARQSMNESAEAVLVEGNIDVCAMHASGISTTVAPLGTAFTDAQARLLRRCAETVTIVFDGDLAGLRATRVAGPMLLAAGLSVRVATMPERVLTVQQRVDGVSPQQDPDSLLGESNGLACMHDIIRNAPMWHEWMISDLAVATADHQAARVATLRKVAVALAPLDELERDLYVPRAVTALAFPETRIRTAILALQKPAAAAEAAPEKDPT
jgi:DNA primase